MTAGIDLLPAAAPGALEELEGASPPTLWRSVIGSREGRAGLVLLALMLALIIIGPHITPYSTTEIGLAPSLSPPSSDHLFGTDQLGRDSFSRFLAGGQSILLVPLAVMVVTLVVGGSLGLFAAYRGGTTDTVINRFLDVGYALPPLLIVLVLIAGFGSSFVVLVLSISFVWLPRVGRVVRGATQAVVGNDYVAAAVARGEKTPALLLREVVPNIAPPVVAETALRLTYTILFVATLNFLGLGAQPPKPDWGVEVATARDALTIAPIQSLAPAAAIALLSIAFNLIADAISSHYSEDDR
jgi:peptide/nickel transport system permease protein